MISNDSLNQRISDLNRGTVLSCGPGNTWSYRKMTTLQKQALTELIRDEIAARGGEYVHERVKFTCPDGVLIRSMR